jgi:hypothetical protein
MRTLYDPGEALYKKLAGFLLAIIKGKQSLQRSLQQRPREPLHLDSLKRRHSSADPA